MNGRKCVLTALSFEKPTRVPLWHVHAFPKFLKSLRVFKQTSETCDISDIYPPDTAIVLGDECFFPSRKKVIGQNGNHTVQDDGWGRIVETGEDAYFTHTLESLLDDPDNLDGLTFDSPQLESRYAGLPALVENARAKGRCVFAKAGGIYNRAHFIRPEQELLCDMLADEGFASALFDKVADHIEGMALETLRRSDADGLFLYDDMASSKAPMFGPALFEKYMLPRYKRIIDSCRKAGCERFFFHSDGNILPVVDMLIEAGFQGVNPLEPRCGMDLFTMRQKYGKHLALLGGICNTEILPRGDKKEIEAHVRPLIELALEGGVVLGMASVGDDVAPETYDYLMNLIYKYGGME